MASARLPAQLCTLRSRQPDQAYLQDRLHALDRDLGPGATGDDVRALHAALTGRGYLPDPELARAYPSWRPIVSTPPARLDVYDDRTTAAVASFQVSRELSPTGIVDPPPDPELPTRRARVDPGPAGGRG